MNDDKELAQDEMSNEQVAMRHNLCIELINAATELCCSKWAKPEDKVAASAFLRQQFETYNL
jgi:hypothetical protein